MTTVVIKSTEPIRPLTARLISLFSPESPPAAIAEKTSGAPLPRASKVTPAIDSEQLNLSEIASKAGDRYESDVEPRPQIAIAKRTNYKKAN